MKKKLSFTILFVLFFGVFSMAQNSSEESRPSTRRFGLGAIVGYPTGLSVKNYFSSKNAIDGALSFSHDHESFHFHVDYLWNRFDLLRIQRHPLMVYYGVGLRAIFWDDHDHSRDHHEDNYEIGIRVPIGLSYTFKEPRIEIFGEIAAVLDVIESTDFDYDIGIGARYYF